jgi:ABC-type lipoprotein release transport system permease subunit
VLGTVLKRGVTLGALGAAIGLGTALLATPVLESLVRNVSVRDVMVFTVSPILLLVVAAAASLIPAWRAAAVHPMETLRAD